MMIKIKRIIGSQWCIFVPAFVFGALAVLLVVVMGFQLRGYICWKTDVEEAQREVERIKAHGIEQEDQHKASASQLKEVLDEQIQLLEQRRREEEEEYGKCQKRREVLMASAAAREAYLEKTEDAKKQLDVLFKKIQELEKKHAELLAATATQHAQKLQLEGSCQSLTQERSRLESQKTTAQNQLTELHAKIVANEAAAGKHSDAQILLASLEKQLHECQGKLTDSRKHLLSTQTEIVNLRAEETALQGKIQKQKQETASLQAELQELNGMVTERKTYLTQTMVSKTKLDETLLLLKERGSELKTVTEQLGPMAKQLVALKEESKRLKTQVDEQKKRQSELDTDVKVLEERSTQRKAYLIQSEDAKKDLDIMMEQIKSARGQLDELKQLLSVTQVKNQAEVQEQRKLAVQRSETSKALTELTGELTRVQNALHVAEKKAAAFKNMNLELVDTDKLLKERQLQLGNMETRMQVMVTEIKQLVKRKELGTVEANRLEVYVSNLEAKVAECRKELAEGDELRQEIAVLRLQVKDLQAKRDNMIQKSQQEQLALAQQSQKLSADILAAKATHELWTNRAVEAENKGKKLEVALEGSVKRNQELLSQITISGKTLQKTQQHISELEASLKDSTKKSETLSVQKLALVSEIQTKTQLLERLKQNITDAGSELVNLRKKQEKLLSLVNDTEIRNQTLSDEYRNAEQKKTLLSQQVKSIEKHLDELRKECSSLVLQQNALNGNVAEQKKLEIALERKLVGLNESIVTQEKILSQLSTGVTILKKQMKILEGSQMAVVKNITPNMERKVERDVPQKKQSAAPVKSGDDVK